jgi:hypothetical protein
MTDLFGQDLAPANPSVQPAKAKHQAMNAISGPNGSDLSEQFDRQSSLANRLKRQLDGVGSTLFTLTWKRKATPLGRPYYQLAASGRRISDSDCGSWQSPMAGTNRKSERAMMRSVNNGRRSGGGQSSSPGLEQQAEMASWPTPTQQDAASSGAANYSTENRHSGTTLTDAASWATPTANEKVRSAEFQQGRELNPREALGPISSGSPAQTESKGQLNPAFSLWLMGYPPEWLNCAPQAMPSCRKSR